MSDIAVEVNHVWKKFHRGELHDSLRDLVPALAKRLVGRGPRRDDLAEGDFWALKDVSFQVKQGEVLGIIGPNGAGKSTLLKILSKIIKPTRGNVRVHGRLRALIEVAAGFHGDLTGRENIYLNGSILGMKKREIDAKFDEIVNFSGIEKSLDTPVKRYSSGMYARLGFAVAAHLDPEILLVDEVLAVGDAAFQDKCLNKMDDVTRNGRTVLFVSHNESAVRRICGQSVLLRDGEIRFMGPTELAFGAYRQKRTTWGFNRGQCLYSSPEARIADAYLEIDNVRTDELFSGASPLLYCIIDVAHEVSLSVELLLRDQNSQPVLFAPLGLALDLKYQLLPDRYVAAYRLDFPWLASGTYSLDIMLADSGQRFYEYVQNALQFAVRPTTHPQTGWHFKQSNGQGSVVLNVEEVSRPTPMGHVPCSETSSTQNSLNVTTCE